MTDREEDDGEVAHFRAGSRVVLEEGGGWMEGGDRVWYPNGWANADGSVRIPIQHRDEEGAACDVDMIIRSDGTVNIRGGSSAS